MAPPNAHRDLQRPGGRGLSVEARDGEVGILELDFRKPETCELVYFGRLGRA
jgi:hypothetical protein